MVGYLRIGYSEKDESWKKVTHRGGGLRFISSPRGARCSFEGNSVSLFCINRIAILKDTQFFWGSVSSASS